MENNKFIESVARLETKVENMEKKTDKLEANNELLYRLAVVSEAQQITNNKQTEQIEKMDLTFNKINDNLTSINSTQEELSKSLISVSDRVNDIEDDISEEKTRSNNRGKFDVINFFTNDAVKIVMTAIVISLLAIIGLKA